MSSLPDVLVVLHGVALTLFVGGTSVLMLTAIIRRLRFRRPLLVWRSEGMTRVPIGPSLFLLSIALGIAYAQWVGIHVPPTVLVGYPAGGIFWFVATWVTRSTVITAYGLVPDLAGPNRAVAWSQVVDCVCTSRKGQFHVVFLYRDRDQRAYHRLDLAVPERCRADLQKILEIKLDVPHRSAEGQALPEIFSGYTEET